jgi:hypothetical protein
MSLNNNNQSVSDGGVVVVEARTLLYFVGSASKSYKLLSAQQFSPAPFKAQQMNGFSSLSLSLFFCTKRNNVEVVKLG